MVFISSSLGVVALDDFAEEGKIALLELSLFWICCLFFARSNRENGHGHEFRMQFALLNQCSACASYKTEMHWE